VKIAPGQQAAHSQPEEARYQDQIIEV
jgi:hypothetical protein